MKLFNSKTKTTYEIPTTKGNSILDKGALDHEKAAVESSKGAIG